MHLCQSTEAPYSISHSPLTGRASFAHTLPADACMVRPEQVEQVEDEDSAFEDHLLLATKRSQMKRNNACLDLGMLGWRAAPCRMG